MPAGSSALVVAASQRLPPKASRVSGSPRRRPSSPIRSASPVCTMSKRVAQPRRALYSISCRMSSSPPLKDQLTVSIAEGRCAPRSSFARSAFCFVRFV